MAKGMRRGFEVQKGKGHGESDFPRKLVGGDGWVGERGREKLH